MFEVKQLLCFLCFVPSCVSLSSLLALRLSFPGFAFFLLLGVCLSPILPLALLLLVAALRVLHVALFVWPPYFVGDFLHSLNSLFQGGGDDVPKEKLETKKE